ncbi:nuclear transport factor 2 family protein [Nostocaceae cyanobacterium CENA369]|uniref:Nuclear transport factor 2 family protein n=1 Tax=Dendronalium phyllosphericum CENA369 TaxID=1725256 RepID=A0A8J7LE33_9NOST|nr:nuclear transport factor 2 family protein [Dendronalium phyllosphericum]MBH8572374.1 nuclear transport factor 2 family protein [Dendronalium phyllosphericum CENA369]
MTEITEIKKWSKFSGKKVDILKKLFLAGESMNLDKFVQFFTDDAIYQFSNLPIVYGPEGIRDSSIDFLKKVEGLHHHIKNIWELKNELLICEIEVTYIRHDGKVFTLPCSDIIRFTGDKIQEMLIYMNIFPVYITPETEQKSLTDKVSKINLIDRVNNLFALTDVKIENFDLNAYISFFTEDAFYQAGNAKPVYGYQGIREFSVPIIQKFKSLAHEVKNIWQLENTVICQVVVIYNRKDDKVFKLPTLNIIQFRGDKISSLQAFGDPSPTFS